MVVLLALEEVGHMVEDQEVRMDTILARIGFVVVSISKGVRVTRLILGVVV